MHPRTLRRQISWTLPANVIYGACNLLLLVTLNKLGGTAVAGDFMFALAIAAPVFMFANLRFSTVLASDVRTTVRLSHYFFLRGWLVAGAVGLLAVATLFMFYGNSSFALLLMVVALVKATEAFSDLCCGIQQRIERMDRIAISLVANGVAMSSMFFLVYFLTRNLTLATASLLFARIAVLFGYDVPTARLAAQRPEFAVPPRGRSDQDWGRLRALLFSAAPLGITAALISLTTCIPRYVIRAVHDEHMLGLFVSVAVVLTAGSLVFRAVELPALPRLARFLEQRDSVRFWNLMKRLFSLFLVIGFAGGLLSLVWGPAFLGILFNNEFKTMGGVLAAMTLAAAIAQIAGMIESSLIAARLTAVQIPIHCLTALSCLLLCLALVPHYGLYGAVLAVTVCRFPFMLIGVLLLRQKLAQPRNEIDSGRGKTINGEQRSPEREAA